jgi:beta-N-acetylglucosaminidase/glucan-binding YG repeat protein
MKGVFVARNHFRMRTRTAAVAALCAVSLASAPAFAAERVQELEASSLVVAADAQAAGESTAATAVEAGVAAADSAQSAETAVASAESAEPAQEAAAADESVDLANDDIPVANGWVERDGQKYWYDDGVMAASKEVYDPSSNAWYWFDADGTMAHDKDVYLPAGGKWVRYDSDGHMVKGEDLRYGGWYHFDEVTGEMTKGVTYVVGGDGGKWVYYDVVTGQMAHGEAYIDYDAEHTGWYLFDQISGAMQYGWQQLDDKTVYYDAITGQMLHGQHCLDGGWVYLDPVTGAAAEGFVYLPDDNKWVYYDPETHFMAHGECAIDGSWYMFDQVTGAVFYGWGTSGIGATVHYDTVTGIMDKGEVYIAAEGEHLGGWYYFDEVTGNKVQGWKWLSSDGGKLVFYDPDQQGTMRLGSGEDSYGITHAWDSTTGALENEIRTYDAGITASAFASMEGVDEQYVASEGYYGDDPNLNLLKFADLRRTRNTVTAAQLDALIESTTSGQSGTLRGHGADVLEAANTYGIDAVYLLAHAILESGWGTSSLSAGEWWDEHTFDGVTYPAGNYYNFFGWGAYDDSAYSSGMNFAQMNGWSTVREALMGGAKNISENYICSGRNLSGIEGDASQKTLYEMRFDPQYMISTGNKSGHQYATDSGWANKIASVMATFYRVNGVSPDYTYYLPLFVNGGGFYG